MKTSAITFDKAIVTGMMEDAVEFCAAKAGLKDKGRVLEAVRRADCAVCEYLRHGLARKVAEYLGSVDETVRSVYTYEPEYAVGGDEPMSSSGVNLIAQVTRKSAAFSSVVAALNAALAAECKKLACPRANGTCYALDVKVADDDEACRRVGYGFLIHSFHVRPLVIWQR